MATGSKTNWFANVVVTQACGASAFTPPTGTWIALVSGSATPTGSATIDGFDDSLTTGVNEFFSRFATANNGSQWSAVNGSAWNIVDFQWPTATANQGTAQGAYLMASAAGGNVMYWMPLATAKVIASGDVFRFTSGSLVIVER